MGSGSSAQALQRVNPGRDSWYPERINMMFKMAVALPVAVGVPITISVAESTSSVSTVASQPVARRACKFGFQCYRRSRAHVDEYLHPGDQNYRKGFVIFDDNAGPEFQTLWQLFNYHDVVASGHLTKKDFAEAYVSITLLEDVHLLGLDEAWQNAGGEELGSVSFTRFIAWADRVGILLPMGLDGAETSRPCNFAHTSKDGSSERCGCKEFRISALGFFCECGHKTSAHRSDAAQGASARVQPAPTMWSDRDGLVEVQGPKLFQELQELLDHTHKKSDNWTRDRGCKVHGVGGEGCSLACASKNREPTPSAYHLRRALRNQNRDLWQRYCVARTAIHDECDRGPSMHDAQFTKTSVFSQVALDAPLVTDCNEWRLFHGTHISACRRICSSNFSLSLSGTGATWKVDGAKRGEPLYGNGIYCAERITKADEYSMSVNEEALAMMVSSGILQNDDDVGTLIGCFCVLVVRCVGGRTKIVTTNEIDKAKLRSAVFDGPFHSILGDRVTTLGKPYREVVAYDKDQIFPEFLLIYERMFKGGGTIPRVSGAGKAS